MSLDRTRSAEAVSSQPMRIHRRNPKRRHAPDYFVRRKDGGALLVDVRERADIEPEDAAKFELTRRTAAALGWDYLVFDDLPGATQQNLRFLIWSDVARLWSNVARCDLSRPLSMSATVRSGVDR